jgi:hypothetical protein
MPIYDRNRILEQFFRPVGGDVLANPNPTVLGNSGIRKGSLVSFNYVFWRHDAYPLVVVSDNALANGKLWGVNLHYLTFPYIKRLLAMSTNNPAFSYASISGDSYMKKAFRSYKWAGVRQVKVMDHRSLLSIMSMVRTYDPAEVQIIRRQVQEQISQRINPKASEMTNLESGNVTATETNE